MQVRVFESEDMQTALRKVKETLGPDALILSSRTVRKGPLGVLGKKVFEVTAAVEPSSNSKRRQEEDVFAQQPQRNPDYTPSARRSANRPPADEDGLSYEELWQRRPKAWPQQKRRFQPAPQTQEEPPRTGVNPVAATPASEAVDRSVAQEPATASRGSIEAELATLGIDAETASSLVRVVRNRLPRSQRHDSSAIRKELSEALAQVVQVSGPILPQGSAPKRVALLGPTGVGKTTTIAKLAADYLLHYGRRIAMVTIDTYRIAAAEQLKVYGEIMQLPVEVVVSPQQLQDVLDRHRDKELILIDTAGRSPRDDVSLQDLQNFLRPEYNTENHLVLAASTRDQDLQEAVRRFSQLPLQSLMFTKLDECQQLGALVNVHLRTHYPLSYITRGQKVPEDLELADAHQLAEYIMATIR